ncbi:MAG: hypothetical protein V2A66_08215 [Pseudomonadota bacterium]
MINISAMPKETLVELLHYIAENERFNSVSENLAGGVSVEEVRAVLRELARELAREAAAQSADVDVKKNSHISRKTREIISYLSPHEEKTLLTAFGLVDKQ